MLELITIWLILFIPVYMMFFSKDARHTREMQFINNKYKQFNKIIKKKDYNFAELIILRDEIYYKRIEYATKEKRMLLDFLNPLINLQLNKLLWINKKKKS